MSRIIEEKIDNFKFTGGFDADGHILMPLTQGRVLIPYRANAIRMKVDDKD